MNWYAIRSIYRMGKKRNGKNIFEERIVVFCGKDWDEALEKAAEESKSYSECIQAKAFQMKAGYLQNGEALIDGYEVWSEFNETELDLRSFYATKYSQFKYKPERSRRTKTPQP